MKNFNLVIFLSFIMISVNAQFKKSEAPISPATSANSVMQVIFSYNDSQTLEEAAERKCPEHCSIIGKQWTGYVGDIITTRQPTLKYYSTCICE